MVAHELKSPIALMRQFGLALEDDNLSEVERKDYQRQLIGTSEQALQLVQDLAQMANLQPSLFPLEPVNPLAICRSLATEMSWMAEAYERRIYWPKSPRNMLIVANHQLLSRVMVNFLNNALRYTEDETPVKVSVRRLGGYVRLGVRDFGPQMPLADYRRLISEMNHLKTVKSRPDSSGLGVFLASQFAKTMGGEIGLVRHRDGVTFFVDLPLSTQLSLV